MQISLSFPSNVTYPWAWNSIIFTSLTHTQEEGFYKVCREGPLRILTSTALYFQMLLLIGLFFPLPYNDSFYSANLTIPSLVFPIISLAFLFYLLHKFCFFVLYPKLLIFPQKIILYYASDCSNICLPLLGIWNVFPMCSSFSSQLSFILQKSHQDWLCLKTLLLTPPLHFPSV